MRIVHLGDVHFYSLRLAPWALFSKRIFGQINLWFHRRRQFDLTLLPALIDRITQIQPDHLLCSGDLTTSSLHSEFRAARDALTPLFQKFDALVVPGNHDRYTFTAARSRRFESYFPDHAPTQYPHHRMLANRLHLVALDPTRPNLFTDRGGLGPSQLSRLQAIVDSLDVDDRLIVLCHYTPGVPKGHSEREWHSLTDRGEMLDVLNSGGRPTLYLHGHVHRPTCFRPAQSPNVLVVNAGAAVMIDRRYPRGQGFWQIDVTNDRENPWRLQHHAMNAAGKWDENEPFAYHGG